MKIRALILTLASITSLAQVSNPGTCWSPLQAGLNPAVPRFGGTKPSTAWQEMANLLLNTVAANSREDLNRVVFPAYLYFNPGQPQQFGDGQSNAMATWGDQLKEAPFVAVLSTKRSDPRSGVLKIQLSRMILPANAEGSSIEVFLNGSMQKFALDAHLRAEIPVDVDALGWNSLHEAKSLFFKPAGWENWMALSFPLAHRPYQELAGAIAQNFGNPSGKSPMFNPLELPAKGDFQELLRHHAFAGQAGFNLAEVSADSRAHGVYQSHQGQMILTGRGALTVRFRDQAPFKQVVMAKAPRDRIAEINEGTVSGTGVHHIGAKAEIIVNSIGEVDLMTFYGTEVATVGPDGKGMAWNFTQQMQGVWLPPGHFFVAPQGSYHWHLNHLSESIAAMVLTPPNVPAADNRFGF